MRIWAFPSFYPFDAPGLRWHGIFAHRQYKGLIENGADLKVICPVHWSPPAPFSRLHKQWDALNKRGYPYHTVYDGVPVYYPRISNMKPNRLVKKSNDERYIDSIINFFKKEGITPHPSTDVFYSQWLPDSVLVQQAAHRLGLKSAILSIGDDVVVWPEEKSGNMQLFDRLMKEADYRFTCAAYLGRETNRMLNANYQHEVVRWGVDYNYFRPLPPEEKRGMRDTYGIPHDKVVILNIGTAIKRKGWLDLFDALAGVKEVNSDFFLVAVHAGPPEFDLDEEAGKRGLKAHFLNLGEIRPEQLNDIFNAADIFCLPSHWEGLANVNVEASSCGLPVLTTNVCGHPELIESGINGILVPPKQPLVLQKELQRLINDKELRETLGSNARKFITNEWGNFAQSSARLYQILAGAQNK